MQDFYDSCSVREEARCILCVVCEHVCICACVSMEARDKNQCLPLLLATLFLERRSPAEPGSPRDLNKGAQCLNGKFSIALSNSPVPRSVFLVFIISRFMGFGYWFVFV